MKKLMLSALPILLAGCATTSLTLMSTPNGSVTGTGFLQARLIEPHRIEVELDGKRYAGDWTTSLCEKETCERVSRLHERHLKIGQATLTANDGSRLNCKWVAHLPKVDGTCRTPEGKTLELMGTE